MTDRAKDISQARAVRDAGITAGVIMIQQAAEAYAEAVPSWSKGAKVKRLLVDLLELVGCDEEAEIQSSKEAAYAAATELQAEMMMREKRVVRADIERIKREGI